MKNISHKKKWNTRAVQLHMELPTPPLIKIEHDDKLDKYFVKLKLSRDPTS